jgi:NADH dehydrogenase
MKILVTGGTGFVGSNIVRAAVGAGIDVVSLSRGVAGKRHGYPVTNVTIDLVRPSGLVQVLHDVDTVVHAAGILHEEDAQSFERAHVGGTANLMDACKEADIGKIVHISALGARRDSPIPYLRTKWHAEEVVESSGIPFTILRPSLMFGKGDRLVTHLIALMRYSPLVPVLGPPDARIQPVWVGDVCTAALRAINDSTTDGRTFQIGGPTTMSFGEIVDTIKRSTGHFAIKLHVPEFITAPFIKLGEQLFDEPPLTNEQLGLLAAGGKCDPHPAAVALGLRMRSLDDALQDYRRPD